MSATEPTPVRDNGPYTSPAQAMDQFEAVTFGIGGEEQEHCMLVLKEALMLADVDPSEFEEAWLFHGPDGFEVNPILAQVIAGWVLRSHLAGYRKSRG